MPDSKLLQADFSGGMFRAGRREAIPPNGVYDASNCLIDRIGGIYKRGGSSYRATAFGSAGLRFIWDGWLAGGQTTLIASPSAFAKVVGATPTSIGGTGMTRAGRPAVYAGKIYLPGGSVWDGTTLTSAAKTAPYYAVIASRLLAASGDRVDFSVTGDPTKYEATDFHKLPGGIEILGLAGLRDSAVVFSTGGIWVISGLSKKLTDEAGNVQQSLDLYNADFTLWGSGGVAGWEGGLVVPGTDGVYVMQLGVHSERPAFQRISDPIVDLYQQYVHQGYLPGQATVFRGHYFLPIIGPSEVMDLLVCRLDLPQKDGSRPWTHLEGPGAKVGALATRVSVGGSRTPELIGALYGATSRAVNLPYLEPSALNETDHDSSVPNWSLTTRAFATGNLIPNLVRRLRLRYQLVGSASPTLEARVQGESDTPPAGVSTWGDFFWGEGVWSTPLDESFEGLEGLAPPDLYGVKPHVWYPRRKRRFVQFRLACKARTSALQVRSLEMFIRLSGRT